MITGYNTDVKYDDRVYHVQTEDRGEKHPVVESLVYCGGEIVASRRTSYAELLESGRPSDDDIQKRMEEQHKRLIREIHNGRFDTEALQPFGHSIVTNRSFDEVVLAFLAEAFPLEQIQLKMTGPRVLREGAATRLKFEVTERNTGRPVCAAGVSVRLVSSAGATRELFSAETDEHGRAEAAFHIPRLLGAEGVIVCRADAAARAAQIKRTVRAAAAGVPDRRPA